MNPLQARTRVALTARCASRVGFSRVAWGFGSNRSHGARTRCSPPRAGRPGRPFRRTPSRGTVRPSPVRPPVGPGDPRGPDAAHRETRHVDPLGVDPVGAQLPVPPGREHALGQGSSATRGAQTGYTAPYLATAQTCVCRDSYQNFARFSAVALISNQSCHVRQNVISCCQIMTY